MPQALIFTAVGLVAVATWRFFRREMDRVAATLAEVRAPTELGNGPRLVRGPDGIYRPDLTGR
ncbi:hypothetical protein EYW49_18275 [Siculibacillus lacustris]|uniref:Uncharacterized protein n=1 Tax=Siculibacillus lacustris TaxID=1549641 RepID=A0A4Q9VH15_9HYPH|nr:hypothetical protein [Siculibacillus lacustris]TBW34386.1 hypothetical protein EYW49_18275 [Siculibacillus lacustris]